MGSMNVIISAWAAHLDHVHDVLCVGVLLLPQVQHFEFLADRRVVALGIYVSEGA